MMVRHLELQLTVIKRNQSHLYRFDTVLGALDGPSIDRVLPNAFQERFILLVVSLTENNPSEFGIHWFCFPSLEFARAALAGCH